jgi:predicted acyl esterase
VNQVEEDYPIPRTEYKKLFLSGDGRLHHSYVQDYKTLSYQADSDASSDEITFVHKFAKPTQLAGYSKVRLYMSCKEHNDMDVFVMIKKIDRHGKPLVQLNCPMSAIPVDSLDDVPDLNPLKYLGASGILRASRRHYLHSPTSEEYNPYHTHDRDEFVKPGYIVRLDIGIWPMGMAFEEGEGIMLVIATKTRITTWAITLSTWGANTTLICYCLLSSLLYIADQFQSGPILILASVRHNTLIHAFTTSDVETY